MMLPPEQNTGTVMSQMRNREYMNYQSFQNYQQHQKIQQFNRTQLQNQQNRQDYNSTGDHIHHNQNSSHPQHQNMPNGPFTPKRNKSFLERLGVVRSASKPKQKYQLKQEPVAVMASNYQTFDRHSPVATLRTNADRNHQDGNHNTENQQNRNQQNTQKLQNDHQQSFRVQNSQNHQNSQHFHSSNPQIKETRDPQREERARDLLQRVQKATSLSDLKQSLENDLHKQLDHQNHQNHPNNSNKYQSSFKQKITSNTSQNSQNHQNSQNRQNNRNSAQSSSLNPTQNSTQSYQTTQNIMQNYPTSHQETETSNSFFDNDLNPLPQFTKPPVPKTRKYKPSKPANRNPSQANMPPITKKLPPVSNSGLVPTMKAVRSASMLDRGEGNHGENGGKNTVRNIQRAKSFNNFESVENGDEEMNWWHHSIGSMNDNRRTENGAAKKLEVPHPAPIRLGGDTKRLKWAFKNYFSIMTVSRFQSFPNFKYLSRIYRIYAFFSRHRGALKV